MIERIEVLRRLQLLRNKIGELEEFKEYRKKEIQEKNNQIESKRTLSEQKHEELLSTQKEISRKPRNRSRPPTRRWRSTRGWC